jgi:16S rRNA processing protein RimM
MKKHSNSIVASVQDIVTREAAEELKSCSVWVSRQDFPELAEGEYYWVDLLGLSALNLQQQVLGQVIDLVDNGAHAVLRLAYLDTDENGVEVKRERLVPFVKAYIHEIDWIQRTIHIDWQLDY